MELIIVPKVLKDKLSEEGAEALVELINKANEKVKEDVIIIVEEKFERRLSEELGKLRVEIANLEGRLRAEIGNLRVEISETKSTMIKWMFIFWITQFIAIIGVLFKVFSK